jgi:hypothetical protein
MISFCIYAILGLSFVAHIEAMHPPVGYDVYYGKKSDSENEFINATKKEIESVLSQFRERKNIGIEYYTLLYFSEDIARSWECAFINSSGSVVTFKELFSVFKLDDKNNKHLKKHDSIKHVEETRLARSLLEEVGQFVLEIRAINTLGHCGYRSKKFTWLNDIFVPTDATQEMQKKFTTIESVDKKSEKQEEIHL